LIDEINEIRVVSHLMINSTLDLLSRMLVDNLKPKIVSISQTLKAQEQKVQPVLTKKIDPSSLTKIQINEFLSALLNIALKMAKCETGPIMTVDHGKGDLKIAVSKGLDKERIKDWRVKIGDRIAGLAVKEKRSFVIDGQERGKSFSPFLRRSEIKQSLVMPLIVKDYVFGVLNMSSTTATNINENIDSIKNFDKLLSAVL